jgi:hypothetical protein
MGDCLHGSSGIQIRVRPFPFLCRPRYQSKMDAERGMSNWWREFWGASSRDRPITSIGRDQVHFSNGAGIFMKCWPSRVEIYDLGVHNSLFVSVLDRQTHEEERKCADTPNRYQSVPTRSCLPRNHVLSLGSPATLHIYIFGLSAPGCSGAIHETSEVTPVLQVRKLKAGNLADPRRGIALTMHEDHGWLL